MKKDTAINTEEEKWQTEENVRIIKRFFELKADRDKFERALALVKKENAALTEELKKMNEYKEKAGFAKK